MPPTANRLRAYLPPQAVQPSGSIANRWVKRYRDQYERASTDGLTREQLETELKRLRNENKRLEIERKCQKSRRPSLPTSRSEIRLYPAANEGLSDHRTVQADAFQPEWFSSIL